MNFYKKSLVRRTILALFVSVLLSGAADAQDWVRQNSIPSAIWGSSEKDIFGVGWAGMILHYDGNTWTPMASGEK